MCLFSWSEQGFVSISHYSVCCLIRLKILCMDVVCFLRSEECWYIFQDWAGCAESILHCALPLCLQKGIWLPCLETFRSCASSKQVASWCYSFLVWHHQRNHGKRALGVLVCWLAFLFLSHFLLEQTFPVLSLLLGKRGSVLTLNNWCLGIPGWSGFVCRSLPCAQLEVLASESFCKCACIRLSPSEFPVLAGSIYPLWSSAQAVGAVCIL